MKKLIQIILLITTINCYSQTELTVVTSDSKVQWTGTKVIGLHQGIVKIKSGKVKMKDQKLVGGHFIIDMTTITCTDIPDSDPIPKKKLESHLKGEDFFDVAKHPTAKFEIDEVRTHPDNPAKILVLGNLTIKGITKRWKIEVEPTTQTDKLFIAQADLRFDRQQFGVAYKGLKDELVHDIVRLNIVLKAK
ncbi:MAG: YceI family protein [Cytophagales bacterium]|nr:YceI family protein [Cytophagales bacterium]